MVALTSLPKIKIKTENDVFFTSRELYRIGVNTICVSGRCPNRAVCFARRRVSVLILGDVCTRNCRFCGVKKSSRGVDFSKEISQLFKLVESLCLKFLVITSVSRDDLPDFGAEHFCNVVANLRKRFPHLKIELLIPDFGGNPYLIGRVADLGVEIIGHNIETVASLYPIIRPKADYQRSLQVLRLLATRCNLVKSSIMLGLGETLQEVKQTLQDIVITGCNAICIGQYLVPEKGKNFPVQKLYPLEVFEELSWFCKSIGFKYVWSHPMVRSSFVGEELYAE